MRIRGLDLEDTPTLLDLHLRGLNKISNWLAALAPESPPELGDAIGLAARDLDGHAALVEVVQARLARKQ
jgi:hypothetical protein